MNRGQADPPLLSMIHSIDGRVTERQSEKHIAEPSYFRMPVQKALAHSAIELTKLQRKKCTGQSIQNE